MRAWRLEQALQTQAVLGVRRHAVVVILKVPRRVPEMVGDEFDEQTRRRRPRQRNGDREQTPGLEIGEVGGERAQRIGARAFPREMLEGGDILVDEELRQLVGRANWCC